MSMKITRPCASGSRSGRLPSPLHTAPRPCAAAPPPRASMEVSASPQAGAWQPAPPGLTRGRLRECQAPWGSRPTLPGSLGLPRSLVGRRLFGQLHTALESPEHSQSPWASGSTITCDLARDAPRKQPSGQPSKASAGAPILSGHHQPPHFSLPPHPTPRLGRLWHAAVRFFFISKQQNTKKEIESLTLYCPGHRQAFLTPQNCVPCALWGMNNMQPARKERGGEAGKGSCPKRARHLPERPHSRDLRSLPRPSALTEVPRSTVFCRREQAAWSVAVTLPLCLALCPFCSAYNGKIYKTLAFVAGPQEGLVGISSLPDSSLALGKGKSLVCL